MGMDLLLEFIKIEVLIRLLFAFFLGGLIGYEREKAHHAAGLRTHILVCVTSAFLVTSSVSLFTGEEPIARIIAAIITGIGFLGAGSIIVLGDKVRGLTSAATVWATAGLGIVVGLGVYFEAIVATVLFLLILKINVGDKKSR
jgi:putative Mg2+ transporter-C (MgtC) family protein